MPSLYTEHLGDLAAQTYEMSGRLCGSCRDLHALWPYIRLSRSSTGLESEGSELELALRKLIAGGLRKILIAGRRIQVFLRLWRELGPIKAPRSLSSHL